MPHLLEPSTSFIIYNPKSSGDSSAAAAGLHTALRSHFKKIELLETQHAGHAEELAYQATKQYQRPLIVSVSGDGGYHEVINGALRAKAETKHSPVCAVLGAGNANDHRRTVKRRPLAEAVLKGETKKLDLLKITVQQGKTNQSRYAHSYAGLGITPVVAVELNKHTLSSLRELWLVLKTFYRYQPFAIKQTNGEVIQLDSLVFANINQMAKVLTLSEDGHPADGKFEIIKFPPAGKLRLAFTAAKSAIFGLGKQPQAREYEFTVVKDMPMQLDGEVWALKEGSRVRIELAAQALETII